MPNYRPMLEEVNADTNRNYEGDPTHGPQFINPLGSFGNGVVQFDLEAVATMWYMMYLEMIGGGSETRQWCPPRWIPSNRAPVDQIGPDRTDGGGRQW